MSKQDEQPLEPIELTDVSASKPERRDAAANRRLILETADRLFAQHGVGHVNMAQIASAAKVGKGTLYRRFANKGILCLALMDRQMADFQNVMLDRMRTMTLEGVSPLSQLEQFLDALVHFTEAHSPLLCEVQREGILEGSSDDVQSPHFWLHQTVNGLLRQAIDVGELAAELDVDYLADALLTPLRGNIFRFQREHRGFSLDRISAGLQTLVAGLRHVSD
ncbi:MAG: TetR family transcriptional regulator [Chloroflexota bacterium]